MQMRPRLRNSLQLASICLLASVATAPLRGSEAEVRQSVADYVAAFNRQDLSAIQQMWAENAVHLEAATGEETTGRAAITADLQAAFAARPRMMLSGTIDRIRLIKPDVATLTGTSLLSEPGVDPRSGSFSAVLVQRDGKWQIDSMEENEPPTPVSARAALGRLAWLVGEWSEHSDELQVTTSFRWSGGDSFLVRTFEVGRGDADVTRGTQIIGWDPRSQQIRSWSFHSDGSFGDGIWTEIDGHWSIQASQTLADGRAASGTYRLEQVDADTLSLELIGHEIEGEPQPTQPAVIVKRAAPAPALATPAPATASGQ